MEHKGMRIAVVGCGAMGSIFAGLLACAGNDVVVLHRNAEAVDLINRRGLRVEGASGDRTVRVRACTQAPDTPVDMVVLAVKAWQVEAAARSALPLLHEDTVVLAMQNGLGSAEVAGAVLGSQRMIVGIAAGFGAALRGPGHAHHHGMETVRLGPYAGIRFDKVERAVDVWRRAGFPAQACPDIAVMQWEKLICNAAYSPLCALTGLTVGGVLEDPDVSPLSRELASETWSVANAAGIPLSVRDPIAHARAFAAKMPGSRPSLLQDIDAGRRSEIDFINGAVVREATRIGIKAPVNELVVRLVKARERHNQVQ